MTDQRTAIVTGAASGIGRATAERLVNDGWLVVGIDLSDDMPPSVQPIVGDAADAAVLRGALGHVNARLNALVCSAGIPPNDRWDDEDAWAELLRVDLTGPYLA